MHIVNAHNASVFAASLRQGIKCLWNDGGKITALQYELLNCECFFNIFRAWNKVDFHNYIMKLCNILGCTFYTGTYGTPILKNISLKFFLSPTKAQ